MLQRGDGLADSGMGGSLEDEELGGTEEEGGGDGGARFFGRAGIEG